MNIAGPTKIHMRTSFSLAIQLESKTPLSVWLKRLGFVIRRGATLVEFYFKLKRQPDNLGAIAFSHQTQLLMAYTET